MVIIFVFYDYVLSRLFAEIVWHPCPFVPHLRASAAYYEATEDFAGEGQLERVAGALGMLLGFSHT